MSILQHAHGLANLRELLSSGGQAWHNTVQGIELLVQLVQTCQRTIMMTARVALKDRNSSGVSVRAAVKAGSARASVRKQQSDLCHHQCTAVVDTCYLVGGRQQGRISGIYDMNDQRTCPALANLVQDKKRISAGCSAKRCSWQSGMAACKAR